MSALGDWQVLRIDHVGVVVDNLDEAGGFLNRAFGLAVETSVNRENLRAEFFGCGDARIEMIEVTDADERASRLGSGHAARIEHVAVEVDDLDKAIAGLAGIGVRASGPPRSSNGFRSVWTVPATSDGVMYQLMERM